MKRCPRNKCDVWEWGVGRSHTCWPKRKPIKVGNSRYFQLRWAQHLFGIAFLGHYTHTHTHLLNAPEDVFRIFVYIIVKYLVDKVRYLRQIVFDQQACFCNYQVSWLGSKIILRTSILVSLEQVPSMKPIRTGRQRPLWPVMDPCGVKGSGKFPPYNLSLKSATYRSRVWYNKVNYYWWWRSEWSVVF